MTTIKGDKTLGAQKKKTPQGNSDKLCIKQRKQISEWRKCNQNKQERCKVLNCNKGKKNRMASKQKDTKHMIIHVTLYMDLKPGKISVWFKFRMHLVIYSSKLNNIPYYLQQILTYMFSIWKTKNKYSYNMTCFHI